MEENTPLIDSLIICVKNKLFGRVKKPHELMHQPNSRMIDDGDELEMIWKDVFMA
jgi:hypothetical protein